MLKSCPKWLGPLFFLISMIYHKDLYMKPSYLSMMCTSLFSIVNYEKAFASALTSDLKKY